jgi:hypothetical protein
MAPLLRECAPPIRGGAALCHRREGARNLRAAEQDSARRAQPAEGQTDIAQEESGSVTSEGPATTPPGGPSAGDESFNYMAQNDLRIDPDAMRELLSDVTRDVTPEGASHDFSAVR